MSLTHIVSKSRPKVSKSSNHTSKHIHEKKERAVVLAPFGITL